MKSRLTLTIPIGRELVSEDPSNRASRTAHYNPIVGLSLTLLAAFGFSQPSNAALTDSLLAHWSFDDCTAKDNSANGHNGTLKGKLGCVGGKAGKALAFNGSDTVVSITDDGMAFTPDDLTVSVWINPNAEQVDYAGVVDKSHSATAVSDWALQGAARDKPNFYFAYCTSDNIDTNTHCSSPHGDGINIAVKANAWNHLVFVKSGYTVTSYLNGKMVSSMTNPFSNYRKTKNPLLIGAANGGDRHFNGLIDEVSIYKRALNSDEVSMLFAKTGVAPKSIAGCPNATTAFYPTTGALCLPRVEVGTQHYSATLKLMDTPNTVNFKLEAATPIASLADFGNAVFADGLLTIPSVAVPRGAFDPGSDNYKATLSLLPNTEPLVFKLLSADKISASGSSASADIDNYFKTLPSWLAKHPLLENADRPTGTKTAAGTEVYPDAITDINAAGYETGQRAYSCSTTPYTLAKTPDKIITFNPDMGKLWLGSLLQGNGYVDGIGALAELPIRQRAPLKLYIDLLSPDVVETVENPDGAGVQAAIGKLVERAVSRGVPYGTSVAYNKFESSSSEDIALKAGISGKYLSSSLKSSFNYTRNGNTKTVIASFVQRGFSVGIVAPQTPAGFFTNAFTKANLQEQVDLGRIGPDNLPVVVSNIAYGRVLLFSVTSTSSVEKINAALDASYNALVSGGSVSLSAELKKVLSEATISVATVGGDNEAILAMIKTGELYKYFERTPALTTYKPLSYQVDNVGDGSAAKFSETTNYTLRECSALPNSREVVGVMARLTPKRIVVPKKNGNSTNCVRSWPYSDGADAYGDLLVDGVNWWHRPNSSFKFLENGTGLDIPDAKAPGTSTLPAGEKIPDGLFPRLSVADYSSAQYLNGRVFLNGQGGTFRIHGSLIDDRVGNDYSNVFDHAIYPFDPGNFKAEGNHSKCKMDVEYTIEKLTDIYKYVTPAPQRVIVVKPVDLSGIVLKSN